MSAEFLLIGASKEKQKKKINGGTQDLHRMHLAYKRQVASKSIFFESITDVRHRFLARRLEKLKQFQQLGAQLNISYRATKFTHSET
jgi:hypothetical protein